MDGRGRDPSHVGRIILPCRSQACADARERTDYVQTFIVAIVMVAVLFNSVLSIINGHVLTLTSAAVIAVEVVLVIAAHAIALSRFTSQMLPWYGLLLVLVAIAVIRALVTGEFEPKLLRDVLIIPTFIILGLAFEARRLPALVGALVCVVAVFMAFEAVDSQRFAALFKIKEFYIGTRNFTEASFWSKDSPLFFSAMRPDGRFISFIPLHRLSSVFLEPVGSETFCIVVWTFICACYPSIPPRLRAFLVVAVVLMIVGTDGRLAMTLFGIILITSLVAARLPYGLPLLYLPGVVIATALLVYFGDLRYDADNFGGRLALSIHLLAGFGLADVLGVANEHLAMAADAGFAYLVLSQSVFGVAILWTFIALFSRYRTADQKRFLHAMCLWLSLMMMVSESFMAMKTASLLWLMFGSLQRGDDLAGPAARAPDVAARTRRGAS